MPRFRQNRISGKISREGVRDSLSSAAVARVNAGAFHRRAGVSPAGGGILPHPRLRTPMHRAGEFGRDAQTSGRDAHPARESTRAILAVGWASRLPDEASCLIHAHGNSRAPRGDFFGRRSNWRAGRSRAEGVNSPARAPKSIYANDGNLFIIFDTVRSRAIFVLHARK